MTSTPDARLLEAHDLARAALAEVTPLATIGDPVGHVVEDDGAVSLRFANRLRGYPGWLWTVTVAAADADTPPTVLEVELLPGEGSLVAPDWVPWAVRLADYQAAQAALAEAADDGDPTDDDLDDADLDGDDLDDDDDLDEDDDLEGENEDFDNDGFDDDDDDEKDDADAAPRLHAGDVDGVDIDELDPDEGDDVGVDEFDPDDAVAHGGMRIDASDDGVVSAQSPGLRLGNAAPSDAKGD